MFYRLTCGSKFKLELLYNENLVSKTVIGNVYTELPFLAIEKNTFDIGHYKTQTIDRRHFLPIKN